jgi:hypothetical protein
MTNLTKGHYAQNLIGTFEVTQENIESLKGSKPIPKCDVCGKPCENGYQERMEADAFGDYAETIYECSDCLTTNH